MKLKTDVVIYADGTYPHLTGGVSTVIHSCVTSLREISFRIVYLAPQAALALLDQDKPAYQCPPNVHSVCYVPVSFGFPGRDHVVSALTDVEFPLGSIHHSHTCGIAGVAAAIAKSRQRGSRMILSEHSLFARDAMHVSWAGKAQASTAGSEFDAFQRLIAGECGDGTNFRQVVREVAERSYYSADAVTYLDPVMMNDAIEFGLNPLKGRIIPNGVDGVQWRNRSRIRRYGTPFHIVVLSRVVPVKGVHHAIWLGKVLKDLGLDFRMSITGPETEVPCYVDSCRAMISKLGLGDVMAFRGVIAPEIALSDADVMMLTSLREAMPMAILEAMGAGVPVVATDTGCVSGMVTDTDGGNLAAAGIVLPQPPGEGNLDFDSDGGEAWAHQVAPEVFGFISCGKRMRAAAFAGPRRIAAKYELSKSVALWRQLYREYLSPDPLRPF